MTLEGNLKRLAAQGKLPHAIMLHENDGGGAIRIVLSLLERMYCRNPQGDEPCGECKSCSKVRKLIHPDVHFVFPVAGGSIVAAAEKPTSLSYAAQWRSLVLSNPDFREDDLTEALGIEGKNSLISVAESKIILDRLSMSALEGGYRTIVVYLPEKMNAEAANRLLKIIEEPPLKTQFIMITHAPENVLETISSRCQRMRVAPSGELSVEEDSTFAALFSDLLGALASRNLSAALEAGDAVAALPSRESAKSFCKFSVQRLRRIFLLQQGVPSLAPGACDADRFSRTLSRRFPRGAMEVFDRASMLLSRNVQSKIVWTDAVCALYKIR